MASVRFWFAHDLPSILPPTILINDGNCRAESNDVARLLGKIDDFGACEL